MVLDPSLVSTGDEQSDPLAQHLAVALQGKIRLIRKLGQGRTSVVYLAEDADLGRRVALKALRPSYARDAKAVERFKREARAMAACPHPSIVPVHSVGETDAGVPYFIMEHIEGETLRQRLDRKSKLPLHQVARIVTGVAGGLTRAHELGLVHRDVKPSDILIEQSSGRILVTDFGLAKIVSRSEPLATLTRTGEVMGTPEYLSPEQAESGSVDARSDQYSLAVMAFEMIAGRLPFRGPNPQDYLRQHVDETPPSLLQLEPDLPPEVAKVIDRGLGKEPGARYSSADAFAEAFRGAALTAPGEDSGAVRGEARSYQRLFIQAVVIYAGVAWGSLEALTWILETFQASTDLRRPALWIVLGLFPVAMALVWLYARSAHSKPPNLESR